MGSKKLILVISLLLCGVLFVWDYIGNYRLCGNLGWGSCVDRLATLEITLVPFVTVLIFSAITYVMREEVFRAWARFAIPAALVSMVLIYLTPQEYGGGFGPQVSFGPGDTALITSAIIVIVSTLIVLVAWSKYRVKK